MKLNGGTIYTNAEFLGGDGLTLDNLTEYAKLVDENVDYHKKFDLELGVKGTGFYFKKPPDGALFLFYNFSELKPETPCIFAMANASSDSDSGSILMEFKEITGCNRVDDFLSDGFLKRCVKLIEDASGLNAAEVNLEINGDFE